MLDSRAFQHRTASCTGQTYRHKRMIVLCSGVNSLKSQAKPLYTNANFPMDTEGRTYHLHTKKGEVANRILSVGSTDRAKLLAQLLEPLGSGQQLFERLSSRGFLTITGRFHGIPVSIISTHMGMPNMDFVVRECRAVIDGQMAVVRLGTCGAVQPPGRIGALLLATHGSISIRRDPDAWDAASDGTGINPYVFSRPVLPDPELAQLLIEEASAAVGADSVVQGLNASGDSFYSSQGRTGSHFDDRNEHLLKQLCTLHPDAISLEMETFQLLDLARCSAKGSIKAMGMCIGLAERYSNALMEYSKLQDLELISGRAALATLARVQLDVDARIPQRSYENLGVKA